MSHDISRLPKWAQQHIAELNAELNRLSLEVESIRRADLPVEPDMPPPSCQEPILTLSKGWDINDHCLRDGSSFSHISDAVFRACSSSTGHGRGWEKTTTQRSRSLYSSRRLALLAARSAFLKWVHERLAQIEKEIQKETKANG